MKIKILFIFIFFTYLKLSAQMGNTRLISVETGIASFTFQNEVANSIIYKSTVSPMFRIFYNIDKSNWENEFSVDYFNSKLNPSTKLNSADENSTKIVQISASYILSRKINFIHIPKFKIKCGFGVKSSFLNNFYSIKGDIPRQYVSFNFYDYASIITQINADYQITAHSEIALKAATSIVSYIGYPESNPRLIGINGALVLFNNSSSTRVSIQYSYNLSSNWKLVANFSSCFEKRINPYPVRLFYRGFGLGTTYQF